MKPVKLQYDTEKNEKKEQDLSVIGRNMPSDALALATFFKKKLASRLPKVTLMISKEEERCLELFFSRLISSRVGLFNELNHSNVPNELDSKEALLRPVESDLTASLSETIDRLIRSCVFLYQGHYDNELSFTLDMTKLCCLVGIPPGQGFDWMRPIDHCENTAYHYWVLSGQPLPESFGDLSHIKNRWGETLSHYAAWSGNINQLQRLVNRHHASPNETSHADWSALHFVAWGGDLETMKYLICHYGIEPGLKNCFNNTALNFARNQKADAIEAYLHAIEPNLGEIMTRTSVLKPKEGMQHEFFNELVQKDLFLNAEMLVYLLKEMGAQNPLSSSQLRYFTVVDYFFKAYAHLTEQDESVLDNRSVDGCAVTSNILIRYFCDYARKIGIRTQDNSSKNSFRAALIALKGAPERAENVMAVQIQIDSELEKNKTGLFGQVIINKGFSETLLFLRQIFLLLKSQRLRESEYTGIMQVLFDKTAELELPSLEKDAYRPHLASFFEQWCLKELTEDEKISKQSKEKIIRCLSQALKRTDTRDLKTTINSRLDQLGCALTECENPGFFQKNHAMLFITRAKEALERADTRLRNSVEANIQLNGKAEKAYCQL